MRKDLKDLFLDVLAQDQDLKARLSLCLDQHQFWQDISLRLDALEGSLPSLVFDKLKRRLRRKIFRTAREAAKVAEEALRKVPPDRLNF